MLSKWPIRNKLLIGSGLLIVILAMLSVSGFHWLYAYRSLVKSLSDRATELPFATKLSAEISDVRVMLSNYRSLAAIPYPTEHPYSLPRLDAQLERERFRRQLQELRTILNDYQQQLRATHEGLDEFRDLRQEERTSRKIFQALEEMEELSERQDWIFRDVDVDELASRLEELQQLAGELPSALHKRFRDLAGDVRGQYRTFIVLTWITSISAALLTILLVRLFYAWVFRPLRLLVKGSRYVAGGDFDYRIQMPGHDEMTELADALNAMTARFQAIRDDLDRQVRERTKQVVRSEQLASVGFLAAGVAHEINNPLASIAMCAESLEERLAESFSEGFGEEHVIPQYVRMIQDEAFRCKEITEKLLDLSRTGGIHRQKTDLRQLTRDMLDIVAHLGKEKQLEFHADEQVEAWVNPQEIKQVVLNLLTNALDCVAAGGHVSVELRQREDSIELLCSDDGCGMTEEVKQHLFEPFFTRRRIGQGTGLGLSISYRIVEDHEGTIEASSAGPGKGSQFRVVLPRHAPRKEKEHRYQAA